MLLPLQRWPHFWPLLSPLKLRGEYRDPLRVLVFYTQDSREFAFHLRFWQSDSCRFFKMLLPLQRWPHFWPLVSPLKLRAEYRDLPRVLVFYTQDSREFDFHMCV